MDPSLVKVLDEFWAVVVYEYHGGGRRLLWSREHRTWLPSNPYRAGFPEIPIDNYGGEPYDDELADAATAADKLLQRRICGRCGLAGLRDHFIAPDVFGMAALYCVQQPDPRVVGSSGGSGTRKHWGSRFGCSAVRAEYFTNRSDERYVDYGEGLIAAHVRDWEWCARCTGTAGNLAHSAGDREGSPWCYVREIENNQHIRNFPYAP